jgi:hypothetical protein
METSLVLPFLLVSFLILFTDRRIFHQAFRSEAAPSFRPIQMRNAHNMVLNLLNSPVEYGNHFQTWVSPLSWRGLTVRYFVHRFSTSLIVSIMYDYDTLPRDDPFISMVERSTEIAVRELRPEVAAVVGEFPICASCLVLPESVTQ